MFDCGTDWTFCRLLTLWFDYGQWSEVYDALVDGIKTIQIDNWLQVIPQLIARIDTQRPLVSRLVHQLLTDIGKQHPQALIYPLTVASKSNSQIRHNAAKKILKNMSDHSSTLVQQAILVRVVSFTDASFQLSLNDSSARPQTTSPRRKSLKIRKFSGERGADSSRHLVARIVARGFGGGVASLFWRAQCEGNVRRARTSSRHDGARPPNSQGNFFQSGTPVLLFCVVKFCVKSDWDRVSA